MEEILTVKILNSPRIVEYRHVHMVDIYEKIILGKSSILYSIVTNKHGDMVDMLYTMYYRKTQEWSYTPEKCVFIYGQAQLSIGICSYPFSGKAVDRLVIEFYESSLGQP